MDYKIRYADTPTELNNEVLYYISMGWKPQGGVCISKEGQLFQAMIRLKQANRNDEV